MAVSLVAEYEVASWNATGSPRTVSVTTAVGDVLVLYAIAASSNVNFSTPTGGTGLTWTLRKNVQGGSLCSTYIWTATATTAQTFTCSVANDSLGGTATNGFNVLRFTGVTGIGNSNGITGSGAPSVSLTTTKANSAIVVANGDFSAGSGARTWLTNAGTFTEQTYQFTSGQYTVYGGFHASAGAAAAYNVGLSAPTGQAYSIVAVELQGGSAPVVDAGPDDGATVGMTWNRLGLDVGADPSTSVSWTVLSGPDQVGNVLSSTAFVGFVPTSTGTYVLRFTGTNSNGSGTDDVSIAVQAPLADTLARMIYLRRVAPFPKKR